MRRMVQLAAALSIVVIAACASQQVSLQNVSLQWKPSSDASFGVVQSSSHKFSFETFKDVRQQPELIAENRENATPRTVTTKDDVGLFVTTHMRQTFDKGGLTTVDSGGDTVISGEVKQFFVEETDTYKANVIVHLTVRNADGATVWSGDVSGSSSTFGRSYSMDNYDQVLSDAIIDATTTLLKDPGFRSAAT